MTTQLSVSTSRVGRKPVTVPSGVEVKIQGEQLYVKGPKGHLTIAMHPYVQIALEKNEIQVHLNAEHKSNITGKSIKLYKAIAGTIRANISNVVQGVTQGFEKRLTLIGVGYKAQAKGKVLSLSLGYSHPTEYAIPDGITIETPTPTEVVIKGVDKERVGLAAAQIRSIRGPEPYKGKGVRYINEVIELKETKKK